MKRGKMISRLLLMALLPALVSFKADNPSPVSALLLQYQSIKNALVSSNAPGAAKAAAEFVVIVKTVDSKLLPTDVQQSFKTVNDQLLETANTIAHTKNLEKQREAFQSLSGAVIAFAKSSNTGKTYYIDYCPMKKTYWLSEEATIRNPYYGNSMLACGNVAETLQ